jgi:hypothetical protein
MDIPLVGKVDSPINLASRATGGAITLGAKTLGLGLTPESMEGTAKNLLAEKARSWYDILPRVAPTRDAIDSRNVIADEKARNNFRVGLANAFMEAESGKATNNEKAQAARRLLQSTPAGYTDRRGVPQSVKNMDKIKHIIQSDPTNPDVQKLLEVTPAEPGKGGNQPKPPKPAVHLDPAAANKMLQAHGRGGTRHQVARRGLVSALLPFVLGRLHSGVFGRVGD